MLGTKRSSMTAGRSSRPCDGPADLSPRLAELRIFPASTRAAKRSRGTSSGDAKHVPDKGLTRAVLNEVKLSIAARELAAMFADSDLVAMGLGGLFRREKKAAAVPRSGRGRQLHRYDFLEGVAREYVEAIKISPRAPVKLIADGGVPVSRVRAWVYKARDREILRGKHGQGSIGIPYVVNPQAPSRSKDRRHRVRKRE